MHSFGEKVIHFNKDLRLDTALPDGIKAMHPFAENPEVLSIASSFYHKFYNDLNPRKLILGINPGRLGAGATGIPFTDTKRLSDICGIVSTSMITHEPSSVFIYELIEEFGGPCAFYNKFYISSVCPLGFIEQNQKGNWVNCNYYDYPELFLAVRDFIIDSLKQQVGFGVDRSVCYVLGKKNARYLDAINREYRFFDSIVTFDHPRYIAQYKSKQIKTYIADFIARLK